MPTHGDEQAGHMQRKRRIFAVLREVLAIMEHARDAAITRLCQDDLELAFHIRELVCTRQGDVLDRDPLAIAARLGLVETAETHVAAKDTPHATRGPGPAQDEPASQ